jgi:hypothetical protein
MTRFPIDPLSVTAAWLSEVLCADVRECHLEQIGIGVGLLGRLYRAHLDGEPDVPRSVVVKLPLVDSESKVPTGSWSAVTTQAKAQRSPKRVPSRKIA